MPIITPPPPSALTELISSMTNIGNSKPVYLYKNENGIIMANTLENFTNTNQFGYEYNFINGDRIYTAVPITANTQIQWNHLYTDLTAVNANLWSSRLILWLDAHDERTLSLDLQKWISKGYNNEIQMIENTSSNSFTYSNNTIDLTTQANIESPSTISIQSFFKLAMVLTIPTQNVNNKTIFQHNRLSIRITQQPAPLDASSQYMIGVFDNGVFKRGVTFKPSDLTFKYLIYCDNNTIFTVSGNTSVHTNVGSFYQATNQKIYIGQDNNGANNSQIKIHELLYYQSPSDDIGATYAMMNTYFSSKWSITTYVDNFNILPAPPIFATTGGIQPYYVFLADNYASNVIVSNNSISTSSMGIYAGTPVLSTFAPLNSKKRLYFNGTDTSMNIPHQAGIFTSNYTLFVLCSFTTHGTSRILCKPNSIGGSYSNDAYPLILEAYWNGSSEICSMYIKTTGGLQGVTNKSYSFDQGNNVALYVCRYNTNGTCSFKINNSAWTTTSSQTMQSDSGIATFIGSGGGGNYSELYFYSMALYQSYLSDSDVSSVITGINSYYNLNIT